MDQHSNQLGSIFTKASPKSSAAFNKFVEHGEMGLRIDEAANFNDNQTDLMDQSDKEYTNHEEMMQVLSDRFEVSGKNLDLNIGGSNEIQ